MSRKKGFQLKLKPATKQSLLALFFFMIAGLVMVTFTGEGMILQFANDMLRRVFGGSSIFLPFIALAAGLVSLKSKWAWTKPQVLLGAILLFIGSLLALQQGSLGKNSYALLAELVSDLGVMLMGSAAMVAGLILMFQISWQEFVQAIADRWPSPRVPEAAEVEEVFSSSNQSNSADQDANRPSGLVSRLLGASKQEQQPVAVIAEPNEPQAAPVTAVSAMPNWSRAEQGAVETKGGQEDGDGPLVWEYPPLSLLSSTSGGIADRGDIKGNAQIIEDTLRSFNIAAQVKDVKHGPSVTQYQLQIGTGTKLSRVTTLSTDLALALAAPTGQVRVEAPIPGTSYVGVEVPNYSAEYVTLRTMLADKQMQKNPSKLAVALGIDVSAKQVVVDIAAMPHVLIAGATGSGKSVCINAFLASILFRASPDEVKLILVDPKRVELTGYNEIPHLLTPVIVEPKKVVSALKWATNEMDARYKQLAEVGVKHINDYNELAGFVSMPQIVIVIDELADVMLFAPKEVEDSVTRIAQMARAVGIHLVLATQRPSVDVITGLIKANVPTRIAFSVSSQTDSRVILDSPGAEKLLGKGDMLYIPPTQAKPIRVQGTYVSDGEIRKLIEFIKGQKRSAEYIEEVTSKFQAVSGSGGGAATADGQDEMFWEAVQMLTTLDKASSSMIQRRLRVGYARAARILDELYEAGLVSPPDGSKPRDIYLQKALALLQTRPNAG